MEPENAMDNNPGTRWSSGPTSSPQWLAIDLGAPAEFNEVTLQWEGAYANRIAVEVSDDGGMNWREVPMLAAPTDVVSIVFAPDDPLVVLALGRDALVASRDGGRVWRALDLGAATFESGLTLLDVAAGTVGRFMVLTDRGLLNTEDGGMTWSWSGQKLTRPKVPGSGRLEPVRVGEG